MCVVSDEEIREVLDVSLLNSRLLGVVSELVVPARMLGVVNRGIKWCLAICGFSQSFGSSKLDPTMGEQV